MKMALVANVLLAGVCIAGAAQPLSPRIANYALSVRLDPSEKTISGKEHITWSNPSDAPVNELQFHLYLNAFRDRQSTFMRESGGYSHGAEFIDAEAGWIEMDSILLADGSDLRPSLQFIHPDDDNGNDRTVARVPLARPVPPHGTIVLDIRFRSHLPHVTARTGYHGDFFMVAQWFPKLGVYEVPGQRFATVPGWNCHQFHAMTEFYADFGVYDVDITLPSQFVVGATGAQVRDDQHSDNTKTVAFHADDVHDFAWTASPSFEVVKDQWRNTALTLLIQPQHRGQADRYMQSLKGAMEYFDMHVGPYPYSTYTIVDPAYGGLAAGGMEYPTLMTGETFVGLGEWVRFPEMVTVHEFGHSYWYGMEANNEFEEAWMDEGINQYYEMRIMDSLYGSGTSALNLCGIRIGDSEFGRLAYTGMSNPSVAPITTPEWKFPREASSTLTYFKTAVVLTTLDRLIGRPVMDSAMKTFFARWRFRHPCARDFVAVFNEMVPTLTNGKFGDNMNWFFDQALFGTAVCDYALTRCASYPLPDSAKTDTGHGDSTAAARPDTGRTRTMYVTRVAVSRLGEMKLPVEIEIRFEDGSTVRKTWDGEGRYSEMKHVGPSRAVSAVVDPDGKLALDINTLNNSRMVEPSETPVDGFCVHLLFWLQNLFHLLSLV